MNVFEDFKKHLRKEYHTSIEFSKEFDIQGFNYHIDHHGMDLVDVPFEYSPNEVIYFEIEYDEAANKLIRENYELIKRCFAKANLRFVYLPLIGKEITEDEQYWKYVTPSGNKLDDTEIQSLSNDYLFQFLAETDNNYRISEKAV